MSSALGEEPPRSSSKLFTKLRHFSDCLGTRARNPGHFILLSNVHTKQNRTRSRRQTGRRTPSPARQYARTYERTIRKRNAVAHLVGHRSHKIAIRYGIFRISSVGIRDVTTDNGQDQTPSFSAAVRTNKTMIFVHQGANSLDRDTPGPKKL